MKRKDEFLRAIQMVRPLHGCDRQYAFGWALNLRERSIPADVPRAARRFIIRISR
jgi:hypothetical protein